MFLHVKAYHNPEFTYSPTSVTRIVGSVTVEMTQVPSDEAICRAVFGLLNGCSPQGWLLRCLAKVSTRYYREQMRSLRTGDLITVSTAEQADFCAEERTYEVLSVGFRRVERKAVEV